MLQATPMQVEPEPEVELTPEEKEIKEKRDAANAEKQLGNTKYKAKEFEAAIKHYTNAIEIYPDDIAYYTNRAGALKPQPTLAAVTCVSLPDAPCRPLLSGILCVCVWCIGVGLRCQCSDAPPLSSRLADCCCRGAVPNAAQASCGC